MTKHQWESWETRAVKCKLCNSVASSEDLGNEMLACTDLQVTVPIVNWKPGMRFYVGVMKHAQK